MLDFANVGEMLAALKPDEPVYALRPHELRQTAAHFVNTFPGDVLYAVKANPHPVFLRALADGGIQHFDVASLKEIELTHASVPKAKLYFMHPVKAASAIRIAIHDYGITHFAADHPDELAKIIVHTMPHKPTIVIRLAMPKGMAVYDLAGKFGCTGAEAISLVRAAMAEGLGIGLSFHVGSQCLDPSAYIRALAIVADVIAATGLQPELIDIGGGFPAAYRQCAIPSLNMYTDAIAEGLAPIRLHHPMRLLCEPGRALAARGASLVVKVQLRRDDKLYLNDGMYGGMSELRFAGLEVPMRVWRVNGDVKLLHGPMEDFGFCGPTCDSADILAGPFPLPRDIRLGDYIEIGQMGAYSMSQRSDFNGFLNTTQVTVSDEAFLP